MRDKTPNQALLFLIFAALLASSARAQIQPAWIARYNNNLPSGQHQALKMALGSDGNIYVCGFSANTNGGTGYATLKFAPNGQQLWAARLDPPGASNAAPTGFAMDASGQPAVTGNAGALKYDNNGNQLWLAPYSGSAIGSDASGNSFVTGFGTTFNTAKLSPSGTNLWTATYQDIGPTIGQAVAVGPDDDVYVGGSDVYNYLRDDFGHSWPEIQFLVVKFSSNATPAWKFSAGMSDFMIGTRVGGFALDSGGNVYFDFALFDNTGPQSSLLTYKLASTNGAQAWVAYNQTHSGNSLAYDLALTRTGRIVITGSDGYDYPYSSYITCKINTNGSYLWTDVYPANPSSTSVATSVGLDKYDNSC